jgi:hypothetical protein
MKVDIQASTFERLQRYARPLVDTIDTVINRAVDALELSDGHAYTQTGPTVEPELRIDPRELPNLTHTKVLEASIEGEPVPSANWNLLRDELLRRSVRRVKTLERVRQVCPVNFVEGRKLDEGYHYLADINLSVQGMDANGACQAIVTAAQVCGIPVDICFMWRLREGAANPGQRARLQVGGTGRS